MQEIGLARGAQAPGRFKQQLRFRLDKSQHAYDGRKVDIHLPPRPPSILQGVAIGDSERNGHRSPLWRADATPAGVTPFSGACTLNFNDGTDYRPGSSTNPVSGTARWTTPISLSGKTKAFVQFMAYLDVEPNGDCNDGPGCSHADLLILEVSTDDFDGCACDPDESCDNFALCSDANTLSFVVPKDQLKAWKAYAFDISAFAGKSVRFRFRFDTLDGFYNEFPGAFVDDVRVVAQ
jgi:hypothetical protein